MISGTAKKALALVKAERPANPVVATLMLMVKEAEVEKKEDQQFSTIFFLALVLGGVAVSALAKYIKDLPDFNVPQGEAAKERSWIGKTLDWVRDLIHKGDKPMEAEMPQGTTEVYPRVPFQPDQIASGNKIDFSKVGKPVEDAIAEASKVSGLSTAVLYGIYNKESLLGRLTVAKTSSARGIAQLTKGTFKEMANKYGKQYGIGANDQDDIRASAILGALYLRDLISIFKRTVTASRPITLTELYLMYLLGGSGGQKFIRGLIYNKDALAEPDMAIAARNNPSVFFKTENGKRVSRTYREVYNYLYGMVEDVAADAASKYPAKVNTRAFEQVSVAAVPVQITPQAPAMSVPQSMKLPPSPAPTPPSPAVGASKAAAQAPSQGTPKASGAHMQERKKQPQDIARTKSGHRVAIN